MTTKREMRKARADWHAMRDAGGRLFDIPFTVHQEYLKVARAYLTERGWSMSDDELYWDHPTMSVRHIEDAVDLELLTDGEKE